MNSEPDSNDEIDLDDSDQVFKSANPSRGNKSRRIIPAEKLIEKESQGLEYRQFLGLILVVGFLVIGSAAGTYAVLDSLMNVPCLGCLGLYPNVDLEFTFDTVDGKPHPGYVLEALKDGPVFIEFTQRDENCPPCGRMRPKVEELEDEFSEQVVFFIINVDENEISKIFQGEKQTDPLITEKDSYHVYDIEKIAGGLIATPTYIIITLDQATDGTVRPSFAVGYGEFEEEDAQKTKDVLAKTLEYALTMYIHYREMYIA